MISFYLLWIGFYVALLAWLAKKWPFRGSNSIPEVDFPPVTLLIPFRNERESLPILIKEIQAINYPFLEILLIDDQSEDQSFDFLKEILQTDLRVRLVKSPGVGKKEAIEFGINLANSELILCTDADCTFPIDWIPRMTSLFSDPKVQLVAGPVMSQADNGCFGRFQQIEWSSILLVTQFFFSKKRPLLCSAANFAYRKSAFKEVGGYSADKNHLSGDDEFLLKRVAEVFGGESCVYLPFSENLVFTRSRRSFFDLINQRIRWAGKWKVHREFSHLFSAVFSFLVQVVWLASISLFGWGVWGIVTFLSVWLGKIAAERLALGKILKSLGIEVFFLDFLKTGIVHPIYVLIVGFGAIRGKFSWKGRSN